MPRAQVSSFSDMYAFGILMWELYTGQQPYRALLAHISKREDRHRALLARVVHEGLRPVFPPGVPQVGADRGAGGRTARHGGCGETREAVRIRYCGAGSTLPYATGFGAWGPQMWNLSPQPVPLLPCPFPPASRPYANRLVPPTTWHLSIPLASCAERQCGL